MKNRIFYLDFLRSFAIIMVLALHCISEYMVQPYLYETTSWYINLFVNAFARCGVPIFFMISGCLMLTSDKTKDLKTFYKKALSKIAIPLVFWNIVYFVYNCLRGYVEFDVLMLFKQFVNIGSEYHLWYLYTLLGIYLVAPFLKMIVDSCDIKKQIWLLILMIFGTTIRPFINQVTPVYIYLFEPLFNGYMAYFLMGYILSNLKLNGKITVGFFALGLFALIYSIVFHHTHSSGESINLIFNSGYSFCHCLLASSIFVISKCVFERTEVFRGLVEAVSKYSFGVYLIHVAVIDLVFEFFMIDASPIVSSVYIFAVTFPVSLTVSFLIGKIKYLCKVIGV